MAVIVFTQFQTSIIYICCCAIVINVLLVISVAHEVERLSTYQNCDGSIPGLGSLHVGVSLSKILNPKLLPMLYNSV